jgi:hypothetical protein
MEVEVSALTIKKFKVGSPFEISFTIQNLTDKVIDAKTLIIHIPTQGKNTIIKSITPIETPIQAYGEIVCTVQVKVNGGRLLFRNYPMALAVEIKKGPTVIHSFGLTLPASLVATNIKSLALPPTRKKLNILIFGEFGSGKTSLMLTMLSALKGSLVKAHPQLGVIGGGQGHASTTFRRIEVTPSICFLDSWGCSPTNYVKDEFRQIITGMFPLGAEMDAKLKYTELNAGKIAEAQKPDAVFFFVTQGLVEDPSYLERLKKFRDLLQTDRPELNPYIILSKIDEIDPKLRGNPDIENEMVQDKVIKVAAETGIPEMNIFPILSYKVERESSEVIDRFAMDLLHTAIDSASQLHQFSW